MVEEDKQRATVGNSGASVNININDGFKLRWTHYALLFVCVCASTYAVVKASEVNDMKTEVRLLAYWAERAEVAGQSQGIKMPPLPDLTNLKK